MRQCGRQSNQYHYRTPHHPIRRKFREVGQISVHGEYMFPGIPIYYRAISGCRFETAARTSASLERR